MLFRSQHYRPVSTLAFCNTKQQCRDLVAVLQAQGIVALELHGDLEQRDRDQVLVQFANRSCSVLVATDVAARGLDIAQLEAVINVDVSPDVDTHTHRVGRTGRAGEAGWAFTLASMDEMGRVGRIDHAQGHASVFHPLSELTPSTEPQPLLPPRVTLQILGGRKEKIRPGDVLMIGEGIETCLAAMQETGHPAWAALSTSGLRALDLPKAVSDVIVLADGDDPGEAAARDCALRWKRYGRRVRIARPPKGMDFKIGRAHV